MLTLPKGCLPERFEEGPEIWDSPVLLNSFDLETLAISESPTKITTPWREQDTHEGT